jgi:hypothetical protein
VKIVEMAFAKIAPKYWNINNVILLFLDLFGTE